MGSELKHQEHHEAEAKSAVRAHVVHEAVVLQGEDELKRSSAALFWSALSAGFSMSLSLLAEAALRGHLPDTDWRPLLTKLGYPVGFLVVVLGRQQLFTENTLTPVLPLLHGRPDATIANVMRLWAVVFIGNMIGAHGAAWFYGNTAAISAPIRHAMHEIGQEAMRNDFVSALVKGIVAGWLIALVVWLSAAVEHAEFAAIFVPTYLVGIGAFTHIIVGSIECLFLVMTGALGWGTFALTYMIPTLIGNVIGGVVLTALLNHKQVQAGQ